MDLNEMLHYAFIQRALIAGSFIAVLCAVLGVLLVLRRLSLIGDGLAHVAFGSVALGLVLRVSPLYASIPLVTASSLGILKLMEKARIYGDAAVGIVSSLGIAGGVLLASMAGGFNVDLFSYLFGNILSISLGDVITSIAVSSIVLLVVYFYYHDILSLTFDEEFAKASGINAARINSIIVMLTAVTVVLTMKIVGVMLTSALLILPAVTAFQVARGFGKAIVIASAVSLFSVFAGIILSFSMNLPAGASIVIVNFLLFAFMFACRGIRSTVKKQ
ncbi:MAG: metal ABC transporter permease [Nitrospirae bacterium]|nr:metal ABC transporter permease [Nitrospirota bacterium]